MQRNLLNALMSEAMAEESIPHTVTTNVGFTTNYLVRGISQTSHNPAIHSGIDHAHSSRQLG